MTLTLNPDLANMTRIALLAFAFNTARTETERQAAIAELHLRELRQGHGSI